jgi:hypothetical protein
VSASLPAGSPADLEARLREPLHDVTFLGQMLRQDVALIEKERTEAADALRRLSELEQENERLRKELEPRLTHGRHCPCTGCASEDWTQPHLGPCGMHGVKCPPIYAPAALSVRAEEPA